MDILSDPLAIEILSGKKQTYSLEVTQGSREVGKSGGEKPVFLNTPNRLRTSPKLPSDFPRLPKERGRPSDEYRERALKQLELRRNGGHEHHPLRAPINDEGYKVYLRMIEAVCLEMDKGQK
jgi:hypothetical protein